MNFVESVSFAYQSLSANKMRAGLTMLGMVIGTASIILVVTIALTGRDYILQQIQGVGSNLIYLYYEAAATVTGPKALSDDLTLEDLKAIQSLPRIAYATGIVTIHDRIMVEGKEREASVIGTSVEYLRVRNLRILSGRFFDDLDEKSFNKVCLLTEEFARRLFGTLDVQGKTIKFFQVRFEVIGIFQGRRRDLRAIGGIDLFGVGAVECHAAVQHVR